MKKRILVFDDDVELLSILEYIISGNGWELHSQTSCNALLDKVRSVKPNVILMDNWIPEIGGMKATQMLKKENELKDIPVIYFSANNDIEKLAAKAGADTFISKPFDVEDLETTLRSFLESNL